MKSTEIIQKPGLDVTLVGDELIINAGELSHSITIEFLKRKVDKHTDAQNNDDEPSKWDNPGCA